MKKKIIFFGTPEFAVASLKALVEGGFDIVAVVTMPDKPGRRGSELQPSAIKEYALSQKLLVLQPEKLKDPIFLYGLGELNADLFVVVAFRMLPEVVWNMPPLGTINLHGSLLPQYRGAAPINWAIINGEAFTGVTTFKLKHEIDTGDILLQESIPIFPEDTFGIVHDKMMGIGALLLVKTVTGIFDGTLKEIPQSDISNSEMDVLFKHAPKIFKPDTEIIWNQTNTQIHNFIRGLSPYPAAFTKIGDTTIKVFSSEKVYGEELAKPGEFKTDVSTYLKLCTTDGWISIKELQPENKRRMDIKSFLNGRKL